jgi:hypothetical protein
VGTADIEPISSDSKLFVRSKRITISGKKIETPRRILSVSSSLESEAKRIVGKDIRGLNEAYKLLDKKKLEEMSQNNGNQKLFVDSIRTEMTKSNMLDEINMLVFSYDNRTDEDKKAAKVHTTIPTSSEVEYLCDLMNAPFVDFTIPPLMPYLTGQQYLQFLSTFFDQMSSYKEKEAMGVIPYLHRIEYPSLIEYYDKRGIRFFTMDLQGGTPDMHYVDINLVHRKLAEIEKTRKESCYLHALNVKFGRPLASRSIAPAKDILSFYYGFDTFGSSHIRLKLKRDLYKNPPPTRPFRLFNRDDYGYYRSDLTGLGVFPKEQNATYQLEDFYGDANKRLRDMAKVFNAERQGIEAHQLRQSLKEEKSITKHIGAKKQITKDLLKTILNMKSALSGDLSKFF